MSIPPPKFSIVTVNYHYAKKLQALLKSLLLHEKNFELIVVDNNSGAEELEVLDTLEENHQEVHVVRLHENLGLGVASNEGARFARGEYIFIVNPDIEFLEPVLETLSQHCDINNVGMVCPQLVNLNGTSQTNAREFPTIWKLFTRRFLRNQKVFPLASNKLTPVPWVQGSFFGMKRSWYDELEGFDDRFFLFFEDTDLCRRSWKENQGVFVDAKLKAQHGEQRLSDASFFKMWFKRTFWIHLSSLRKYYFKYIGEKNPELFEANSNTAKKEAMKHGKIFFFSGPSGVGKGTIIDHLREKYPEFVFPPSCTTRDPRPGEKDGETYYFITKDEFKAKIEAGEFLEYAEVHGGNFYGTLKQKLIEPVEQGKTVIREFDVQGFTQARERLPRDYYESIFIKPEEGEEELVRRIKARAPISDEDLAHRMESMKKELDKCDIYDHIIISKDGNLEHLFADTEKIVGGR